MNRKGLQVLGAMAVILIATGVVFWSRSTQGPMATPTPTPVPQRSVKLFFYNPARDRDTAGNVQCSSQGLVAVNRQVAFTNTPIQDTVRLLLTATPSPQEYDRGLVSEFPLAGVQLTAASQREGTLTLTFVDPDHRTGGGSCFVGILRAQVEATAEQFGAIHEVRLMPEELFQP